MVIVQKCFLTFLWRFLEVLRSFAQRAELFLCEYQILRASDARSVALVIGLDRVDVILQRPYY